MTAPRRFLTVPQRDVWVRRVPRGACGPFIDLTLDFEPAPEGFVLETFPGVLDAWEAPHDIPLLLDHLARGIQNELRDEHVDLAIATRAVLTRALLHPVDSGLHSFLLGGRYVAREALRRTFGSSLWEGHPDE